MPTTITDNGASIKISDGPLVRNVTKGQIVEVSVIKVNIIRIDIGQGPLKNIFIPYGDVTAPVTANAGALRDKINDFLVTLTGGLTGSATEARQTEQIGILNTISGNLTTVKNIATTIDNKVFYEPLWIDNSGPGIVYKGYALPGSVQDAPAAAIERIQTIPGDIEIHTWADGNKNLDNVWINREALVYS
jgi:hypothetical protein